jgi:hypothetical protein
MPRLANETVLDTTLQRKHVASLLLKPTRHEARSLDPIGLCRISRPRFKLAFEVDLEAIMTAYTHVLMRGAVHRVP